MTRAEFTKATQRAAWGRADGRCEASGTIYGLPATVVCGRDLRQGVEYDHLDPDANSKDASLENCRAVCPPCHRWKTSNRDRPLIAKTDHQQDKARGIMEAIYAYVTRRAENDYALLRVITERPEIEVKVERRVLQLDGTSTKGRIAKLIADGFLDVGVLNGSVVKELNRTGASTNSATVGRALQELVRDGFLTKERDESRTVKDMRVNIVGDRA